MIVVSVLSAFIALLWAGSLPVNIMHGSIIYWDMNTCYNVLVTVQ